MKYKVGDKVRIKSLDWYNKHKDEEGYIKAGTETFLSEMSEYCGKILTIKYVSEKHKYYLVEEDIYAFTEEMIGGLVKERSYDTNYELDRPDGYQFEDQDGNIINATKIILTQKKNKYPETYEECCDILGCKANDFDTQFSYNGYDIKVSEYEYEIDNLLQTFRKLRYCRDAYWKIAGEEMGLGESWKPDWTNSEQNKYCIYNSQNDLTTSVLVYTNAILTFPTAEIRDIFYKNFEKLIEQCKEFL